MVLALLLLAIILCLAVMMWQLRSHRKYEIQSHLMLLQSQEIKKQLQELQQQNQLLEQLNNEKQQIIGVVSHDLKGPFNRIFALTQLMGLTSENFTDEQKDYVGKIHQIVADGLGMVRNLLDNRRLEDKHFEITLEAINVSSLIASQVKNYRVLADKKKIKIHLDPLDPVFVLADKTCLNRIMDNLLSNAIKFSPSGKNIFVSLDQSIGFVRIRVKDEGPGIIAEDYGKLFLKYQRLSSRPTGGESSTGLGLYLVKSMVNKMEGEVICEREEGLGAVFSLRLKSSPAKLAS